MTDLPQLRDDLIVSRQQAESAAEAGGASAECNYVIKLPESGRYFRLREREYKIGRAHV